jgi:dUTP pyrophosphatase
VGHVDIAIHVLPHGRGLNVPTYMTIEAAGADAEAAVLEQVIVGPGDVALIPLGFEIAIPRGYEGQLRPRSGLAAAHKVTILNSPATIDSDYRGEVSVLLINHGAQPFHVRRGQRIAQLVVCPVVTARFRATEELPPSQRSGSGFGSTGTERGSRVEP